MRNDFASVKVSCTDGKKKRLQHSRFIKHLNVILWELLSSFSFTTYNLITIWNLYYSFLAERMKSWTCDEE